MGTKKPKKNKKIEEEKPFVPDLGTGEDIQAESLKQKKIRLAQGEFALIAIEILKECMQQIELVSDTQWQTTVNSIKMDTQANILRDFVDKLEEIRQGSLHEIK